MKRVLRVATLSLVMSLSAMQVPQEQMRELHREAVNEFCKKNPDPESINILGSADQVSVDEFSQQSTELPYEANLSSAAPRIAGGQGEEVFDALITNAHRGIIVMAKLRNIIVPEPLKKEFRQDVIIDTFKQGKLENGIKLCVVALRNSLKNADWQYVAQAASLLLVFGGRLNSRPKQRKFEQFEEDMYNYIFRFAILLLDAKSRKEVRDSLQETMHKLIQLLNKNGHPINEFVQQNRQQKSFLEAAKSYKINGKLYFSDADKGNLMQYTAVPVRHPKGIRGG